MLELTYLEKGLLLNAAVLGMTLTFVNVTSLLERHNINSFPGK